MSDKIRAVIVDDERQSLEVIEEQIKMYCEQVEILATFDDPIVALKNIKELKPDVAFLDINMPKMDGLDLAENIIPEGVQVIFITAHSQHAIQAIKLSALDYLLKPIENPEELKKAVAKIKTRQNDPAQIPIFRQIMGNNDSFSPDTEIALSDLTHTYFYKIKDIIRVKAEKNYCCFFFTEKRKKMVSKNMGYFSESLHPYGIVQANRSELVNLAHKKAIVKNGPYLLMSNSTEVSVTSKYKGNFPFFDKD